MSGSFQPILPAEEALPSPASSQGRNTLGRERPKRDLVAAACLRCRKAKAKCDGHRPSCGRCVARESSCEYDIEPGASRSISLKRKYTTVLEENTQLWDIIQQLRSGSESEAAEVLRRIRAAAAPAAVLHLTTPTASPFFPPSGVGTYNSVATIVDKIDRNALLNSFIKCKARPWTVIANDGLVSELISIFFEREHPFLMPFIDKENFLTEMESDTDTSAALSCSPLLVNIICAHSAFSSESAKKIDTIQGDLIRERFFDEFKALLDQEKGRASIPTVHALILAFSYCCCAGRDRAGTTFRCSASEMFNRLRLGVRVDGVAKYAETSETLKFRNILSRGIWGVFTFESISAFLYLQSSLIPVPAIGRYFCQPIFVNAMLNKTLDATADLSIIMRDIMMQCNKIPSQQDLTDDIQRRMKCFRRLDRWHKNLPCKDQYKKEDALQYYGLRAYYHVVAVALFRPLQSFNCSLPNQLGTSADFCLEHCRTMVSEVVDGLAAYPAGEKLGSVSCLYYCYCSSFTLIPRLNVEPLTHEPFTLACSIFSDTKRDFPVSVDFLRGLKAVAAQLDVRLPEACKQYFESIKPGQDSKNDIPISYVLPGMPELTDPPADDEGRMDDDSIELGRIIAKWNEMSMNSGESSPE